MPYEAVGRAAVPDGAPCRAAVPYVAPKAGTTWGRMLLQGGMVRSRDGRVYAQMAGGVADLFGFDHVDGLTLGPHAVVGLMTRGRQRWEMEQTLRQTTDRAPGQDVLMWHTALRWLSPVEQGMMVELRGGRMATDYHQNRLSRPGEAAALADGFMAWRGVKLIDRRMAGLRLTMPLGADWDVAAALSWEQRHRLSVKPYTQHAWDPYMNEPRLRDGMTVRGMTPYDGPVDGQMALLDVQLSYQPHRTVWVLDDMTATTHSTSPRLTLTAHAGMGRWHYVCASLKVSQSMLLSADHRWSRFSYEVSGGKLWKHEAQLGLADWHHFEAMRFWLQGSTALGQFRGLDNYELSTDRHWLEAHAEVGNPMYVQLHMLSVPGHRFYWEWQHGFALLDNLRLSWGSGMNGWRVHSVFATLSVSLDRPFQIPHS